ncbi:hypothetical protein QNI19_33145 [Cytophagaceae bacterium DM2B3-1]|uniref:Lipoprotein n=1 Tax=Xanthocytophaga flava TaxID=3048013 RepID=A0ABT7CVN4_9BACT|nr:hypothetical protein [Xanthocytophaga flavus]MDJ1497834.1 hypothetical protein [Xanthocytophaga flavus]
MHRFIAILFLILVSCQSSQTKPEGKSSTKNSLQSTKVALKYCETLAPPQKEVDTLFFSELQNFNPASYYLQVKDTSDFLRKIECIYSAQEYGDTLSIYPKNWDYGKILSFEQHKIYGSDQKVFMLFFEFFGGSSSSYPPLILCILNKSGKILLYQDHCDSLKYFSVFKNKNPFLLTAYVTGFGNGRHHLYMYHKGKIRDALTDDIDIPNTIDMHEDDHIYDPYFMNIDITDLNKDGYNDLRFSSTLKMICTPKIPDRKIHFDFTFRPSEQTFRPIKDYPTEYYHPDCK